MKHLSVSIFGAVVALSMIPIAVIWPPRKAPIEIIGTAVAVDGDTVKIKGASVRLHAIDAPEIDQTCTNVSGSKWPCGIAAKHRLVTLIAGHTLHCFKQDTDRYGRIVAICNAGDIDVGSALVRAGLAIAYRRYSEIYVADEDAARLMQRGIWSGTFEMPENYRRGR